LSEVIKNTEELCSGVLETLHSLLSSAEFPKEDIDTLTGRVEKIQDRLSKARNKVVMRTPKGKELSQQANDRLIDLQNLLKETVEKEVSQPVADVLEAKLKELEASLDKIETFYRSYESELT